MEGRRFVVLFLLGLLMSSYCAVFNGTNASSVAKTSNMCLQGSPGLPGRNGVNGHNGVPGRVGRDAAKGQKGVAGTPGPRGVKGEVGPSTDTEQRNWKQCAWRGDDGREIGLVKDCQFTKTKDNTALRVVYQGNFYFGGCGGCCKRWFITFNGAECSGPLPIDVAMWIRSTSNGIHRPGSIEGYCDNIHKGKIRVGINIGKCTEYGNTGNGNTGWNSVSRLIIQEVPRSQ